MKLEDVLEKLIPKSVSKKFEIEDIKKTKSYKSGQPPDKGTYFKEHERTKGIKRSNF